MLAVGGRVGWLVLLGLVGWFVGSAWGARGVRALDRYVAKVDGVYGFELVREFSGEGVRVFVLELVSQSWLREDEVDRTVWRHWLRVVVPSVVKHRVGLLVVGGGSNGEEAPSDGGDGWLGMIARETGSVVAELGMVPNQPLRFFDEVEGRSEDGLIAFGWDRFLRGGRVEWLAQLPMTRSVVRGMDAVSDFVGGLEGVEVGLDGFVVAGGSKRGWTAWLAAAVDERVVAVVPMVIDLLNLEVSFGHHYRVYGFFAPAVGDYVGLGIMDWLGSEACGRLLEAVEPYAFRGRLGLPKFLVNAAGDEFFVPDSGQFYWDGLVGEKFVRYVPNVGHGLDGSDVVESLTAFYHAVLVGRERPRFGWRLGDDGSVVVEAKDRPREVQLWWARNREARDFRIDSLGARWESSVMEEVGEGRFVGGVSVPEEGFTAFFAELVFAGVGRFPLKFTTLVKVVPDVYPFDAYVPKGVGD